MMKALLYIGVPVAVAWFVPASRKYIAGFALGSVIYWATFVRVNDTSGG